MTSHKMAAQSMQDPCSFSQPDKFRVKHIDLDLTVDFNRQIISGNATLTVEKLQEGADTLVLDTHDLTINQVNDLSTGQELRFALGEPDAVRAFGSRLEIYLTAGKEFRISIAYSTSPKSSALQWLRPEQTAGKRHAFLFSQCQAIHARSLYPCQDTPGVKFTYKAKVKAPQEITILMSALRLGTEASEGDDSQLTHHFEQKIPIPSYLMAIVGGDLESRKIGPRSTVWSEKEIVDQAKFEFAETEEMLQTAERLLGDYVWGQYDLLVLPPSFPFGGMENPCLTFVTPTLLAGDRSLADTVAHEISHSWTGNLVTNSTNPDFWLNEGHTVFVERKITSCLHGGGEALRSFLANAGWKSLQETVDTFLNDSKGPYTRLIPDLRGEDPDDVFSNVPYEKGFALLYYLESLLGGPEVFEKFLRAYIDHFKYRSISSNEWKDYLFGYFSSETDQYRLQAVDWNAWFYAEGMPPVKPQYDTSLAEPCRSLSSRWLNASDTDLSSFASSDLQDFSPLQKKEFLSILLESESPLSETKLVKLESLHHFNEVRNSEIQFKWLRLCLKGRWADTIPRALKFVNEQGRMKFVRPVYRDLYEWEYARQAAIDNFLAHRREMHNTTAKLVAQDLHLPN